jgi:hypothetical protein
MNTINGTDSKLASSVLFSEKRKERIGQFVT